MKRFLFGIVSILALCSAGRASAADTAVDAQWVQVQVSGLSCPFCAYGLEKRLKKLEGTTDRHLHFEEGILSLKVLPDGAVLSDIAEAIRRAGFTPGRMQIQDRGEMKRLDGEWIFVSSTTGETFTVSGEMHVARPGEYKIRAAADKPTERKGDRSTLQLLENPELLNSTGEGELK